MSFFIFGRPTRRESIEEVIELSLLEPPVGVVEMMEWRQRREVLTEALHALPERCREVMLLRYLDGCSGKEIAGRLGISLGTVNGHLLKGVRDCSRFGERAAGGSRRACRSRRRCRGCPLPGPWFPRSLIIG